MRMRFTWDPAKNESNQRGHGVSFETEVFADPFMISIENYYFPEEGEQTKSPACRERGAAGCTRRSSIVVKMCSHAAAS